MGRKWKGLVVAATALFGLMGCHKTDYLQPPKPKDVFAQPPADDSRFTGPPIYPAKLLNQDTIGKDNADDDASSHGLGHGGGGGGMHGP